MDAGQRSPVLLAPLIYIPWFIPMLALGWWITDLVGAYPSVADGPELIEMGLGGWLLAVAYGVVCAWPSWLGVGLALRARRPWAYVAFGFNLVIGLALVVSAVLPS